MSIGLKHENKILLLADFYDGNKAAIDFAIKYLYNDNSTIYLMQSWQKPSFGSSMLRNLSPLLKDISKRELKSFKSFICEKYKLPKNNIRLINHEGDMISFFKSKLYSGYKWQVVLALNNSNLILRSNPRLKKLLMTSGHTFYVLNNIKLNEGIKCVQIRNMSYSLNPQNITSLNKICNAQNCDVIVNLDVNNISISEKVEQIKKYSNACEKASVRFEKTSNLPSIVNIQTNKPSLIIVCNELVAEANNYNFLSYIDKWFVKSKGISIGNF
jgi:hypothetical protein